MFALLVRRVYLRGLRDLERRDFDAVLGRFDPACRFEFAGVSPLGARLRTHAAIRAWFERLHAFIGDLHFDVIELAIGGPPWDTTVAARNVIRGTLGGQAYENRFAQFLRLRWGRVVSDVVLEDTQHFAEACQRLAGDGFALATAPPIEDGPPRAEAAAARS